MFERRLSHAFNVLLALTSIVTLFAASASAQPEVTVRPEEEDLIAFPRGNWSLGCVPYMGPGYEDLPVLVHSVTSELGGGVTITKIGVENRSSRVVKAVRLKWFLTTERDQNTPLKEGQTSFLRLPGGVPPGASQQLRFDLVSFGKVYKLLRRADDGGKFLLHVAVSEARFENDSTWTLASHGVGARRAKAAYRYGAGRRAAQAFCPNQRCDTVVGPDGSTPVGYKCGPGASQSCANSSDGMSCTSSICGSGGGGGPRPPTAPIQP